METITIQTLIQQDFFVQRLQQNRCRKCRLALTCDLVYHAKRAKPGTLVRGLLLEQRDIRCREFQHVKTIKVPYQKPRKMKYTGETLFPEANFHVGKEETS